MPINPISVKTTLPDFKAKSREIQREFRKFIRNTHKEITDMAKETLRDAIRLTDSVASQRLLKSVSALAVANSGSDGYTTALGFKKPASSYALYANEGRPAGLRPPLAAIQSWARAKGIPETAVGGIWVSIGMHGTQGKHFMEVAEPKIRKKQDAILRKNFASFKRLYK